MPTRLRNLTDTNLSELSNLKNKNLVRYNNTTNRFELFSTNELLVTSTTDGNVSDSFVQQLEQEIDTSDIIARDVDAGTF